ncbi:acyltransferase family protein [Fundidesulfovibrio butyratiphilus]
MPSEQLSVNMVSGQNHERQLAVDVIKIVAIVGVLVLHSCDLFLDGTFKEPRLWWVGITYASLSIIGVPLFLMCSGALLLKPGQTYPSLIQFYKHRLSKILVPLFIWSVVYYLCMHDPNTFKLADFGYFFRDLLQAKISKHFWYLYMMIGVYLSAPFLNTMFANMPNRYVVWFFLLCFLLGPPNMVLLHVFYAAFYSYNMVFCLYLGYYVVGYYLYGRPQAIVPHRKALALGLVLMVGVTMVGSWLLKGSYSAYPLLFFDYSFLNIILSSVLAFALLRSFSYNWLKPYAKWVTIFGNASYGVYLVHILFRDMLRNGLLGFRFAPYTVHPILGIPLSALGILLFSLALVFILKRIPVLRHAVP